ncbi:MAG: trigger factor [Acetobacteraceae bacterium]|nr:trigger factor [Acetobacteraceae bacterium]
MQVTETLTEGLKRGFTVVVPAADIESRRAARFADLGKQLRLPGFRPGKVPLPLVRRRYGTAVNAEVLEESVNEATQQVLSDRGLRPAMQPKVDLLTPNPDQNADLEFKVELELLPDIAPPDFSEIELTRLKAEVAKEDVDRALGEIASRARDFEDVTEDRGAETGDMLTVDFVGTIDGTPFPGGAGSDADLEIGGSGFIPGFSEGMAGMRPGEKRDVTVTFPEGYHAAELAGKEASFEVTAKKLRRAVVPALDDDLGKKLGFDGLDEVREAITQRMQREYDQLGRVRLKRDLLDALAKRAGFPVPQGLLEGEFAQIWQRVEADRKAGKLDPEDASKDEETLRSEYRAIAERRVRLGLLLAEIGRLNGVTVGNDEMTRAIRMEASRYPGQEQQVVEFFRKNPQAAESLRGPIFEEKVVDYVLDLARVTDRVVTPEELAREPEADGAPATSEPPPE